jgi:hypothetical protein
MFKDDFELKYGDCEDPEFISVTCDFEESHICGYESDQNAQFTWVRNKGDTNTIITAPTVDV